MDRKLTMVGDEELAAVSGGFCGTPPGRRRKMPAYVPGFVNKESSATATGGSNTVGDVDVRGGHNTVIVYQDASAEANSSVS